MPDRKYDKAREYAKLDNEPETPEPKEITGPKYPCLFELTDNCPVRKQYKLAPESIQPFCLVCPLRILKIEREKK